MIESWLKLGKQSEMNQVVFKNAFFSLDFFKIKEQELFTHSIEKIVWKNAVKKDTILLDSYELGDERFKEVQFFEVELRTQEKFEQIHTLFQRAITFPLIVTFRFNGLMAFGGALKLYGENGSVKKIVESTLTEFKQESHFEDLKEYISNRLRMENLKEFYMFIYNGLKAQVLQEKSLSFKVDEDLDRRKAILIEKEKLEKDIEILKKKLSKESHVSRKVSLGIELRGLQDKLITITKEGF